MNVSFKIRALLAVGAIFAFTVFIAFLYKLLRDASTKRKLLIRGTLKDLFIPTFILSILWLLEATWVLWIEHEAYDYVHFFYELFLILITFLIVITYKTQKEYLKENINYYYLAKSLKDNLGCAHEKVLALSFDDFNNFFEPLGLWYFCEQARIISKLRETYPSLIVKRIIVIQSKITNNELLRKAFGAIDNLTYSEKNLKNIDLLHFLTGIDLFLVPREEILKIINQQLIFDGYSKLPKRTLNKLQNEACKNYDRIIIDSECFYPRSKKNKFEFSQDKDSRKYDIITNKIFEVLAIDKESKYYIEKIKELYPLP